MFRFLLLAAAAYGQTQVHNYPADHFSIAIPEGWQEVPADDLRRYSENLAAMAPDAGLQVYKYGFQRMPGEGAPRVLIQVKEERWAENVFSETAKLPRSTGLLQHGVTAMSESLAALQPKIGEMRWDPDNQTLWMRTRASDLQILSGAHVTNTGSVQVHCSSASTDYDKYAPDFITMIGSVHVDDSLRYVPRSELKLLMEDYPWWPLALTAVAALIGLSIVGKRKSARRDA